MSDAGPRGRIVVEWAFCPSDGPADGPALIISPRRAAGIVDEAVAQAIATRGASGRELAAWRSSDAPDALARS